MPGDPPAPVNAAADANQPSGVASVGLKLPDLNWVNYLPAASKDPKHKDDWKLDFEEWKEMFLENAGFVLRPKFVPDETDRKWLYRLALLRAFVHHPALRRAVHTLKKTKEEKALLDAISLTILNPKRSEKRKAEEKYLAMKRERGEDLFTALNKEQEELDLAGGRGYTPDESTKRRALERSCLPGEWNDSVEKASIEHQTHQDDLTYDQIRPYLVRKAEIMRSKKAGSGGVSEESRNPRPQTYQEFGAAAEGRFVGKGKGKGHNKKGKNKREVTPSSSSSKEAAAAAAAAAAASGSGQSPSDGKPCKGCGFTFHKKPELGCPAANATCNVEGCGQKGHWACVCPKKNKGGRQAHGAAAIAMRSGTTFDMRRDGSSEGGGSDDCSDCSQPLQDFF